MPLDNLYNKNIGIIYGGWSEEREISLQSGKAVYDVLKDAGYHAFILDLVQDKDILDDFTKKYSIDLIFNLIHGKGGEDGLVQSWIEDLKINFVGSDSQSSRDSFSKIKTKKIWSENKLKTPDYITSDQLFNYLSDKKDKISNDNNYKSIIKCKEFFEKNKKFILKPNCSGSSVGVKIYDDISKLWDDNKNIFSEKKHDYLIERFINGTEYTAPIINGEIFPVIKITTQREFYNYEAKYIDDNTSFTCPDFNSELLIDIKNICLKAFDSLNCDGWGRVDFFIEDNDIYLIEINTIPGMTNHSLVPMSAKHKGLKYLELVEELLLHV